MQLIVRSAAGDKTVTLSEACTLKQLKMVVENETFIPSAQQALVAEDELLVDEEATCEELGLFEGMEVELLLDVEGGAKGDSRYKKATSKFRWKWNKKRTRRLQKKRRKMRMRAR
eukprot:CAMPEP_0114340946 /NCGR_PEP_ID=MMETSP0101-20121206/8710_1 /TAXON_ID=38822 ORGANISM="Pteridomonas danica, Strain PT" /NCGR_SAMPLE_ID=MMETSP0101 /ASSEMBLY_ACC=CAM_ASM_000211 /LENGTH=114 /DNA_ID=CAMNT_0001474367 /DNA_START=10 /DNA_END=354 /DNA_ORIENTATION=-